MIDLTHSHDPEATRSRVVFDCTRRASDVDDSRAAALSTGMPVVPGYSLSARIGEGGMGAVYKAIQVKLNRTVALKMIHGGRTAGSREMLRFLAEAEAVAAIDHPHVVKVFDTGDANGQLYIAMEFLPGGTLTERLSDQRKRKTEQSSRETAELVRKLALAVQAAHDRQIVHRDLKPSNIMFDAAGEPRITDFGLAKRASGDLTHTNAIMGTPAYMAPEQAKGESKFVGPQADVWALGVILYEALCGRRPFTGSGEFEVIERVIKEEPESLRSLSREIPKDLELIAQKCLRKDPAARYATAGALAVDLANWLDGKPVSVKAAGSVERTLKWIRRNRIATGVVAASVMGVILASVLAVMAFQQREAARAFAHRADEQTDKVTDAYEELQKQSDDLNNANSRMQTQAKEQRYLLDVLRIRESSAAFEKNLTEYAFKSLSEVAPENRTAAWRFARRNCEGLRAVWLYDLPQTREAGDAVAFSADARHLAVGSQKRLHVIDTHRGTDDVITEFNSEITCICTHDDAMAVSFADGRVLLRCASSAWKTVREPGVPVRSLAWMPAGAHIAVGDEEGRLQILDSSTGNVIKELEGRHDAVTACRWSPRGNFLLSGDVRGQVLLWQPETEQLQLIAQTDGKRVDEAVWSPDGGSVAWIEDDAGVKLLKPGAVKPILLPARDATALAWNPDGRTLAVADSRKIAIWDVTQSKLVFEYKGHQTDITAMQWAPDGRVLISYGLGGTIAIWDIGSDSQSLAVRDGRNRLSDPHWSADSRTLLCANGTGVIAVETLKGEITGSPTAIDSGMMRLAWSPDQRQIAVLRNHRTIGLLDRNVFTQRELPATRSDVVDLNWSPECNRLAVALADGTIEIHDTESNAVLQTLRASGNVGDTLVVAWSADGQQLASGGLNHLAIWNTADGQLLKTIRLRSDRVHSLAWSPCGQHLAAGGDDSTIRLWDPQSGECTKALQGQTGIVQSLAWSPCGRVLAVGRDDGVMRLWDPVTGLAVLELKGHQAAVDRVVWSPDGNSLATADANGALRIWQSLPHAMMPELVHAPGPVGDGFRYVPRGEDHFLKVPVNLHPDELVRRAWLFEPHPDWHREQAKMHPAAAAFHWHQVLLSEPMSLTVWKEWIKSK